MILAGVKLIPIGSRTELDTYGFDGSRFASYKNSDLVGGKEWHGPCPWCGGDDRLNVSNGCYKCRVCRRAGTLAALIGDRTPISYEERAKWEAEADRRRAEEAAKKAKNLEWINCRQVWKKFHANLLANPARLEQMERDGIPLWVVRKFQVGYNLDFRFWENDIERHAPAFTFPIFQPDGNGKLRCANVRHRILANPMPVNGKYRPIAGALGISYLLAAYDNDETLIITEGEKKALVLYAHGFSAAALFGVNSWDPNWAEVFRRRFKYFFVIFDGDNPQVITAANTLASIMDGRAINDLGGKVDDLLNQGTINDAQLRAYLQTHKELIR